MSTQSAIASRVSRKTPDASKPMRKGSFWTRVARSWQLWVLLAPGLAYLIIFKYWPLYGAQIAFRNYNPVDGFTGSPWVGLQHFERFIGSFQFKELLVNTLTINTVGLLAAFPVPIVLALIVNQLSSQRFKKFVTCTGGPFGSRGLADDGGSRGSGLGGPIGPRLTTVPANGRFPPGSRALL